MKVLFWVLTCLRDVSLIDYNRDRANLSLQSPKNCVGYAFDERINCFSLNVSAGVDVFNFQGCHRPTYLVN